MCSDLSWSTQRLDTAKAELSADDTARFDDSTGVVLLPCALREQPPANLNCVINALRKIEELPTSHLLAPFMAEVQHMAEAHAEKPDHHISAFAQRLAERLPEPLPEPLDEPYAEPQALSPTPTQPPRKPLARDAAAFDRFITAYGYNRDASKAQTLYWHWRDQGASEDELLRAAANDREDCELNGRERKYAKTFLARKDPPWKDAVDLVPRCEKPGRANGVDAARRMIEVAQTRAQDERQLSDFGQRQQIEASA